MQDWILQLIILPLTLIIVLIRVIGTLFHINEAVIEEIMGIFTLFYGWILAIPAWILYVLYVPDAWNPFLAAFSGLF